MSETEPTALRRPWSRSDRPLARAVRPLQEFLRSSIASAVPLLIAAVLAVVWANSPWWRGYERIWSTPVDLAVGRWAIHQDVRFWVNEGLMTAFFLLAGLEIKRELVTGELRDRGAALLPVAAAIGGMAVPALIYLAVTAGTPAADGWGMAMPTDLALSLAVVVVAARAAPPRARPFLLTLAIADDVLTVAVVAVFYAGRLSGAWLLLALVAIGGMLLCERVHVRSLVPYLALGAFTWYCAYEGGVHPALVGAVLGLLAPAHPFQRPADVHAEARRIAELTEDPDVPDVDAAEWIELSELSREAVSPVARIEHALLPWVNLGALPLFALANAGVRFAGGWWSGATERRLIAGLLLARLVGKVVGIVGTCAILQRFRIGRLPEGLAGWKLAGIAAAAGAPFTVSLFVAGAVFAEGSPLLAAARAGVLVAVVVCGLAAIGLLLVGRSRQRHPA